MKKLLAPLCLILPLFSEEWGDRMPSEEILNSGEIKTIKVSGESGTDGKNYFYNYRNFTYSTNGLGTSELIILPKTTLGSFYNKGHIYIDQNSKLSMNFTNSILILQDYGSYTIQKNAGLEMSGQEFTIYAGTFLNKGITTLNISGSVNNNFTSGTKGIINEGGSLTINAEIFHNGRTDIGEGSYGVFETTENGVSIINVNTEFNNLSYIYRILDGEVKNKKNADAISILKASSQGTLSINGGDVYNGGHIQYSGGSGSKSYYSGAGYIIADNGTINIEKNLISKGAGEKLSAQNASEAVYSKISAINKGVINIKGNFTNGIYSNVVVSEGGSINVGGSFQSGKNTNIIFGGDSLKGYGNISANNADISGANLVFYKGDVKTDTTYVFLETKNTLNYDASILGIQNTIAQDGSENLFYQAFIENDGNRLKITFQDKTGNQSVSEIISQNTELNQNERIIIDAIDTQKPINTFDIRNLSATQIKETAKNIEKGFSNFANNKNMSIRTGFNTAKTLIFNRMIKVQSLIAQNQPLPRYAANTINPYGYQSDQVARPYYLTYPSRKTLKTNALYASILGAYQKNTAGSGYDYGFNAGYDKTFNKNLFLGFYANYLLGDSKLDSVDIRTQSLQIGTYARLNTSFLETDIIFSYINARNNAVKEITIASDTYSNHSRYNTQAFNLLIQAGPKIVFGTNIIKPYIGINAVYEHNNQLKEKDELFASEYFFKNNLYVGAIAGIEYRKYSNGGYFFIQPSIEYTFYSNLKATQIIFLNNTLVIPTPAKENFASLLVGGEFPLNSRFLVNINASLKASNQKTLIAAGSASLKFIF
ncbi:hypothetical protein BKH41_06225 [Helicobacter sp. 12S02232-10]|uniref:autotransporter outer membrane beta-barrel domain-containing protein n=1 Tax=Helicobacter sp. 12S02232-10 TaxID=1476197 RepID=UPI000BA5095F|nr:autotransporter outer membrane beta-barrel domain-containing protein [Helicobacter sp. 12S02232-10]PAF48308.1 hypothetical protein BKH41_06225 [Helicobacter sp. 12S02232-10]